MFVISLSYFKESGVVYIKLLVQCYLITYKISSEEKLSQLGQKKQQNISIKSFYSNTSYGSEYKKIAKVNCLIKCSKKEKSEQEEPMQKQPPEVFYEKRCSQKFQKFIGKPSVPESLFVNFCEFCEISKNTFSTEHHWTTASSYAYRMLLSLKMFVTYIFF